MLKIKKKASVTISLALAIIALFCVVAVAVWIPFWNWTHLAQEHIDIYPYSVVIALLYLILIPALVADVSLLRLLSNVSKSLIFTPQSVALIRTISWCCFAETVLCLALGVCSPVMIVVAFAAAFLGVVLRVVKNVIEEAVDIKSENDFTV